MVLETAKMTEVELGAYCSSNAIYVSELNAWKVNCMNANNSKKESLENELMRLRSEVKQLKAKDINQSAELKSKDKELDRMKDALAEYAVKEAFLKKSSSLLRQKQRGNITSAEDKVKILQFIDENHQAVPVGNVVLSCGQIEVNRSCILSIKYMAEILGIGQNTYTNWKKSDSRR